MPQYDLRGELLEFHDVYVKLNDADKQTLSNVRDTNLERIRNGLGDVDRPAFRSWRNQGGYAMATVVNDPSGQSNHDIDVALVFDKDDLPAGALQARQTVRDALIKRGVNFADEPEARTNAVTVWYADGYHLDFAVYRRTVDFIGNEIIEHAGTEWVQRDPVEVTDWFDAAVENLSPKPSVFGTPSVRKHQLRRIVRLVKWFSRSRTSWDLPGGMIISTLVVECYRPDPDRDDISLYQTLQALEARLKQSAQVFHPEGDGRELTGKEKYLRQVERLGEKLSENLPKLAVLSDENCSRADARSAWDWIFNHASWAGQEALEETASLAKADIAVDGYHVSMACDFTGRSGRAVRYTGIPLPRGLSLKFFVTETNVPPPFDVRFEAKNTGEEARRAKTLEWSANSSSYDPSWVTSTAFAGRHRMTCNIVKNGLTLASTSTIVRIAGKGRWKGR